MAENQLSAEQIIAELRDIAREMALYRNAPGEVLPSVRQRISDFLLRAGVPFGPWANDRKVVTGCGTVVINGRDVEMQVHKKRNGGIIDSEAGKLCATIAGILLLVDWKLLPEYGDWTPDRAEAAIREAAKELPELCDQLELASGLRAASPLPATGKSSESQGDPPARWSGYHPPGDWHKPFNMNPTQWRKAVREIWIPDGSAERDPISRQRGDVRFQMSFLNKRGVIEPNDS